ncbi:hypothetical protein ABW20_dc0108913 [Dactylellina cionopaga]|nr:hypothetical protein ABW20_dc0108913 [Dactylellina cionopaga]
MNMPGLRYNVWYPERNSYPDYGPIPGPAVFYDGSDKIETPGGSKTGSKKMPQDDKESTTAIHSTASTTTSSSSHLSLPDGFSTIPWPSTSSLSTKSPLTSTITITEGSGPTPLRAGTDAPGTHYSSHAFGTTFQYRHWHRGHAGMRRR